MSTNRITILLIAVFAVHICKPAKPAAIIGAGHYPTDSIKTIDYLRKANNFLSLDKADSASYYAGLALQMSLKENNTENKAVCFLVLAKAEQLKSNNENALLYYMQSLMVFEKLNNHEFMARIYSAISSLYFDWKIYDKSTEYSHLSATTWKNIKQTDNYYNELPKLALAYENRNMPDSALFYYKKIQRYNRQVEDTASIVAVLHTLANIYKEKKHYEQTIDCYREILQYNRILNDTSKIIRALNNLGFTYELTGQTRKSIQYLTEALQIASTDRSKTPSMLINIGVIYHNSGDFSNALRYFNEALSIQSQLNKTKEVANINNIMATTYLILKEYDMAEEKAKKGLKNGLKAGSRQLRADSYKILSEIYNNTANYKEALVYYAKYNELKDSIKIEKNNAQEELMLRKYYTEKTEKELKLFFAEEEMKDIELQRLKLEKKNQQMEFDYLLQSKELQERQMRLQMDSAQQSLQLARQTLAMEQRDKEILILNNTKRKNELLIKQKQIEDEKNKKEIKLLEQQKELQRLNIEKQKAFRNYAITGFFLVLIILLLILIGFVQNRRKNIKLARQNTEIQFQKEEIQMQATDLEEKNEEINQQKEELMATLEDLHATQNKLIESEKMASLGLLVAGVAHEMNTPIGISVQATSGIVDRSKKIAQLMIDNRMKKSDFKEFLSYLYTSGGLALSNLNRASELIKSFKQVSVDQSTEQKRKFELKTYLDDVVRGLQPKFKNRNIDLTIECKENTFIKSYPGAFAQIITNFILNSLLHGFKQDDKGIIKISTKFENDKLYLQYKDNGTGMTSEVLNNVFEPFYTTNKQQGTGLGMHIVYNLVTQKLKGEINCTSKAGEGVLFNIIVPL